MVSHSVSNPGTDEEGGGTLYVVATPIGNLADITLRALEVLKNAAVVAAEDTRHSRGLLQHYAIATRLFALHEHNERAASAQLLAWLAEGKDVALVTDAGTPAISDPGAVAVRQAQEAGFAVVPIPGPSALIAALSASGIAPTGFRFLGFLPAKSGERAALLAQHAAAQETLVFYEAPHRIVAAVAAVAVACGPERPMVICRELTKRFESIQRCAAGAAAAWLAADENRQRGEFVVLVEGAPATAADAGDDAQVRAQLAVLLAELPLKQAVAIATKLSGAKRNAVYAIALELQAGSLHDGEVRARGGA